MKQLATLFLCVSLCLPAFAADGYTVKYDGGSLQDVKSGSSLKLFIEGDKVRFAQNGKDIVIVPASSITDISYGQDVHRRVGSAVAIGAFTLGVGAPMALSKS